MPQNLPTPNSVFFLHWRTPKAIAFPHKGRSPSQFIILSPSPATFSVPLYFFGDEIRTGCNAPELLPPTSGDTSKWCCRKWSLRFNSQEGYVTTLLWEWLTKSCRSSEANTFIAAADPILCTRQTEIDEEGERSKGKTGIKAASAAHLIAGHRNSPWCVLQIMELRARENSAQASQYRDAKMTIIEPDTQGGLHKHVILHAAEDKPGRFWVHQEVLDLHFWTSKNP